KLYGRGGRGAAEPLNNQKLPRRDERYQSSSGWRATISVALQDDWIKGRGRGAYGSREGTSRARDRCAASVAAADPRGPAPVPGADAARRLAELAHPRPDPQLLLRDRLARVRAARALAHAARCRRATRSGRGRNPAPSFPRGARGPGPVPRAEPAARAEERDGAADPRPPAQGSEARLVPAGAASLPVLPAAAA